MLNSNSFTVGHKSSIHAHLNYLVIVTPPFFPTLSSPSATVRNLLARSPNAAETDITKVVVFDPENKLVAYSGTFKQDVRGVISQWGDIYILSTDGSVSSLIEGKKFVLNIFPAHVSQREVNI